MCGVHGHSIQPASHCPFPPEDLAIQIFMRDKYSYPLTVALSEVGGANTFQLPKRGCM